MIQQGQTYSFKNELIIVGGIHSLTTDVLNMALYTSNANLTLAGTTTYTSSNEVVGSGYVAGGTTITGVTMTQGIDGVIYMNFNDVVWPNVSIICHGALIYNSSKANRSIAILDFGSDIVKNNQPFTVKMPVNSSTTSLLRWT